jgi:hypothetical protein
MLQYKREELHDLCSSPSVIRVTVDLSSSAQLHRVSYVTDSLLSEISRFYYTKFLWHEIRSCPHCSYRHIRVVSYVADCLFSEISRFYYTKFLWHEIRSCPYILHCSYRHIREFIFVFIVI